LLFRAITFLAVIMLSWGIKSSAESPFCMENASLIDSESDASTARTIQLSHDSSNDSGHHDPCHRGICHFGHCVHIRIVQVAVFQEKPSSRPQRPYTAYTSHNLSGTTSRHERPPISIS
jgi:endogenous inhibitor of DNA gyrase (YacG/DUF329 family)